MKTLDDYAFAIIAILSAMTAIGLYGLAWLALQQAFR